MTPGIAEVRATADRLRSAMAKGKLEEVARLLVRYRLAMEEALLEAPQEAEGLAAEAAALYEWVRRSALGEKATAESELRSLPRLCPYRNPGASTRKTWVLSG